MMTTTTTTTMDDVDDADDIRSQFCIFLLFGMSQFGMCISLCVYHPDPHHSKWCLPECRYANMCSVLTLYIYILMCECSNECTPFQCDSGIGIGWNGAFSTLGATVNFLISCLPANFECGSIRTDRTDFVVSFMHQFHSMRCVNVKMVPTLNLIQFSWNVAGIGVNN